MRWVVTQVEMRTAFPDFAVGSVSGSRENARLNRSLTPLRHRIGSDGSDLLYRRTREARYDGPGAGR